MREVIFCINLLDYVYQFKDHLGNVRLSYSDKNKDGSVTTDEIVEVKDYYPFGMQINYGADHPNSRVNGRKHNYGFNGVELEENLGLDLYEMDFRKYDPAIARWMGIDPVTHYSLSPYNAFDNNPVFWADPSGADGEHYNWDAGRYENDQGEEVSFDTALASQGLNADGSSKDTWRPVVGSDGSTSYVAEEGDNAKTFAQQYGLTSKQANILVGTDKVEAGVTTVSGQNVKDITGSEILKLDLTSGLATDQRKFDQFIFGGDYSKSKGKYSFSPSGFFSNYGYGISGTANLDYGSGNGSVYYEIPFRRESTFDGSGDYLFLANSPSTIKQTTGRRFNGQQSNIRFDFYHPQTGGLMGQYELQTHNLNAKGVYNRMQRKF